MGFIKEPDGVILYVENRKLTPEEKKALSELIAKQNKKSDKENYKSGRIRSIKNKLNKKKHWA